MALKAVLFDLDDTLADHQHCFRSAVAALRERYTALQSISFEEVEQLYSQLLEELHQHVLSGRYTLEQARAERFKRIFAHFDTPLSADELQAVLALHRGVYQSAQRPILGAVPLLQFLREANIKTAVVTNNIAHEQVSKLKACHLEDLIDVLVISEEVGFAKPDAAIFNIALERLHCRAEEACMVGDRWSTDILGAVRVGIRAIWLNRYEAECPDSSIAQEIRSYEPIENALQALGLCQSERGKY